MHMSPIILGFALLLGTLQQVNATSLPPCPKNTATSNWNKCEGTFDSAIKGEVYIGEWHNGKPNGQGTVRFRKGGNYVGEFRNNSINGHDINGQGTWTYPDGQKYVGEFRDDKRHGQGTLYAADGMVKQSGVWKNNEFVGAVLDIKQPVAKQVDDNSRVWGALFKEQVEKCWKKPPNTEAEVQVSHAIKLSREGVLLESPVLEAPAATPASQSYQKSLLQALADCQPYKLPLDYYAEWKYFAPVFSERRAKEAASTKAPPETGKPDVKTVKTTRIAPPPSVEESALSFQQLAREVREHAAAVRKSCAEHEPSFKVENDMQGIKILSLKGDGARDLVVDNEGLCGTQWAGANCSNRGCDLRIYKEVSLGQWRKVFEEHLHAKYLTIDYDRMRLQLIVATIFAGDPRCKPNPNRTYTSGMSCNLIATYRDDRWNWQLIR